MSQEVYYTSAPRGLKPGSRGFCTVVSTSGMATNLADRLESLSGYRHVFPPHDPQAGLNPVVCSHLRMAVGGRTLHVLSRICDAGLDYTQRSNKFAHHVVLDQTELPPAGPAWLLAAPGYMQSTWDGEPRIVPAGRRPPYGDTQPGVCRSWQQVTGDPGWGGALAETARSDSLRPAVIIFRPGTDVLPLIAESLALLPPAQRWHVTFSTYYGTKLPPNVDCQWRCVVEGTSEAAAARRLPRALVIDLRALLPPVTGGPLVETARTGVVAATGAALGELGVGELAPDSLEEPLSVASESDGRTSGRTQEGKPGATIGGYGLGPPPLPGGDSGPTRPAPRHVFRKKKRSRLPIIAALIAVLVMAGFGGGFAVWWWATNPQLVARQSDGVGAALSPSASQETSTPPQHAPPDSASPPAENGSSQARSQGEGVGQTPNKGQQASTGGGAPGSDEHAKKAEKNAAPGAGNSAEPKSDPHKGLSTATNLPSGDRALGDTNTHLEPLDPKVPLKIEPDKVDIALPARASTPGAPMTIGLKVERDLGKQQWKVVIPSTSTSQVEVSGQVGVFAIKDDKLCFQWHKSASNDARILLRNSVLRLTMSDGEVANVCLRMPDCVSPVSLDKLTADGDNLDNTSTSRLEVKHLLSIVPEIEIDRVEPRSGHSPFVQKVQASPSSHVALIHFTPTPESVRAEYDKIEKAKGSSPFGDNDYGAYKKSLLIYAEVAIDANGCSVTLDARVHKNEWPDQSGLAAQTAEPKPVSHSPPTSADPSIAPVSVKTVQVAIENCEKLRTQASASQKQQQDAKSADPDPKKTKEKADQLEKDIHMSLVQQAHATAFKKMLVDLINPSTSGWQIHYKLYLPISGNLRVVIADTNVSRETKAATTAGKR